MNFEIAPKSTEIQSNWDDARLYCFSLNIDEKSGWRLPTKEELNEIHQSENDFEKVWYWSSTEYNGDYACLQNMRNGFQSFGGKSDCGYVRSVRSID